MGRGVRMKSAGSQSPAQAQRAAPGAAHSDSPGVRSSGQHRHGVAVNIERWAAVAAVLVSATALVVTVAASRNQTSANDSQRQVNNQREQEYEAHDASQIAWSSPLA